MRLQIISPKSMDSVVAKGNYTLAEKSLQGSGRYNIILLKSIKTR